MKKNDIINYLVALKKSEGWKILVKILDLNIEEIDKKLHGIKELENNETIEILQNQWADRKQLKELPEMLINEYKDKEVSPINLDPYS